MTRTPAHPIVAATPGPYAIFDDGPDHWTEQVLAWDAEGRALVLDTTGHLTPADTRDGYRGLNGDNSPATIIPASGLEAGSHLPIVAYRIDADGHGTPLVLDGRIVRPVTSDDPTISDRPAQVIEL